MVTVAAAFVVGSTAVRRTPISPPLTTLIVTAWEKWPFESAVMSALYEPVLTVKYPPMFAVPTAAMCTRELGSVVPETVNDPPTVVPFAGDTFVM